MVKNRINRKYYALIWLALIFSTLVCNIYVIYTSFAGMDSVTSLVDWLIILFRVLLSAGAIPTAICFLAALIIYGVGARNYILTVSRNDFIYTVMIFTAIARLLGGIIDAFCIIMPAMFTVTSAIVTPLFETVAYVLMFFFVFVKRYKLNPVEKANAFMVWGWAYLVILAISVALSSFLYIVLYQSDTLRALVNELIADVYEPFTKSKLELIANIVALAMFVMFFIGETIGCVLLRKKAKAYRAPETRAEYFDSHPNPPYERREDAQDIYGDLGDKPADGNAPKDDKVFDEFDI